MHFPCNTRSSDYNLKAKSRYFQFVCSLLETKTWHTYFIFHSFTISWPQVYTTDVLSAQFLQKFLFNSNKNGKWIEHRAGITFLFSLSLKRSEVRGVKQKKRLKSLSKMKLIKYKCISVVTIHVFMYFKSIKTNI